jgi:hypothetical protein
VVIGYSGGRLLVAVAFPQRSPQNSRRVVGGDECVRVVGIREIPAAQIDARSRGLGSGDGLGFY